MFKLLKLKVWPSFSEHIRQVLLLKSHALSKYKHVGLQSTDKKWIFYPIFARLTRDSPASSAGAIWISYYQILLSRKRDYCGIFMF